MGINESGSQILVGRDTDQARSSSTHKEEQAQGVFAHLAANRKGRAMNACIRYSRRLLQSCQVCTTFPSDTGMPAAKARVCRKENIMSQPIFAFPVNRIAAALSCVLVHDRRPCSSACAQMDREGRTACRLSILTLCLSAVLGNLRTDPIQMRGKNSE